MTRTRQLSHAQRVDAARSAYAGLGADKRAATVLDVQCARGHQLAKVYRTAVGLVYVAANRSRSHGKRDQPDTGHAAGKIDPLVELLLDPPPIDAPDAVPAWCDCGPHSLLPAALQEWVCDREGRVVIDG
jgi:hypothetical protein